MTTGLITNTLISPAMAFAQTNDETAASAETAPLEEINGLEVLDGESNLSAEAVNENARAYTAVMNSFYEGDQVFTGKATPNSPVFISRDTRFFEYIKVYSDSQGNFSKTALVQGFLGMKAGEVFYYKCSEDGEPSQTSGVGIKAVVLENKSSFNVNDFELEYKETYTNAIAITKAGAKATDKYGNSESVTVTSNALDTSKPGVYYVTFKSASGKTRTVKVTVKEPSDDLATITANDFSLEYKETYTNAIAIAKAGAKANDKYGNSENVTVTSSVIDTTKPGTYDVTFKSASGKTKTVKATVKRSSAKITSIDPIYEGDQTVTGTYSGEYSSNNQFGLYTDDRTVYGIGSHSNGKYEIELLPGMKLSANQKLFVGIRAFAESGNEVLQEMSTIVLADQSFIEANNATVSYGSDWSDEIAKQVTEAKATDRDGKAEAITVSGNVDTSKAGDYKITLTSASGLTKEVTITVKRAVIEAPKLDDFFEGDTRFTGSAQPGLTIVMSKFENFGGFTYKTVGEDGHFSFTTGTNGFGNLPVGTIVYFRLQDPETGDRSAVSKLTVLENKSSIDANDFSLEYGETYSDDLALTKAKAKATDKYGNSEKVTVKSNPVDPSKPGVYDVVFESATGKTITIKVTVKAKPIIGSEPIIEASDKTYQVGETLNPLLGVKASDPEDGDLTAKVKADTTKVNMSKVGVYDLVLTVIDNDDNITEKTIKIYVVDKVTSSPVIKGADDVRIDERSKFEPLKDITAQDSVGKDITSNLTFTGTVDTSTPGIYTVKYYVFDSAGNVATVIRKITVQGEDSKPVVLSPDKLTIKLNSKFNPFLYVQAYDKEDGNLTDKVTVQGQIYTDRLGKQIITYSVEDSDNNKTSKTMEVEVVAILGNAPAISGADDLEIENGSEFDPLSGVTAYDKEDGDLTAEIKFSGIINTGKAGKYEVLYTVWDSDFNVESVVRTITVAEPTVDLVIEAKNFDLDYKATFNEAVAIEKAQAKAFDKYGKAEAVTMSANNVDTSKPGVYDVTFTSASSKTITVKVTVNEPSEELATIEANGFDLDYKEAFNETVAIEKAQAKAYDKYGKVEAVTMSANNVDTSKPGAYEVTFTSVSGKTINVSVTVKEPGAELATFEAHDFELEYKEVFDDALLIEKAKAKAYDKYGNEEEIIVLVHSIKTAPGNYRVMFESASGKRITVDVVVKEPSEDMATITVENGTVEVEYASEWNDEIARSLFGVKATDKYGTDESNKVVVTVAVNFSTTKPGDYLVHLVSPSNNQLSKIVNVIVKEPSEDLASLTVINEMAEIEYGSDWNDAIAHSLFGVKATDKYGTDESDKVLVKVSSGFSTSKPGIYNVTFISPSNSKLTEVVRITVMPNATQGAPVTVNYVDTVGEKIAESDTLTGIIDTAYETKAKDVKGYMLIDTPNNEQGVFTDKAQTVTYIYEKEQNLTLKANEFTIGRDTYITGTAGTDVKFVDLYVNGMIAKRADVIDGTYKIYGTTITDLEDNVQIVALDAKKKQFDPSVTVSVELAAVWQAESKMTANNYHLGDTYVTGTYDNDQADRVKLFVDGKVVNQVVFTDTTSDAYKIVATSYITSKDQKVEVLEYDGTKLINRVAVDILDAEEVADSTLTANDYVIGESIITGTYDTDRNITKVVLYVDGVAVKNSVLNTENGTYSVAANSFIKNKDQKVEIVESEKTKEVHRIQVKLLDPSEVEFDSNLTADDYMIGAANITGAYDTDKNITKVVLYIDGIAKKNGVLNATNGTYSVAAKNLVTSKSQKVEIVESAGTKVVHRIQVTVLEPSEVKSNLAAEMYAIGTNNITGTYDTDRDVTKVVLYVDGVAVKNSTLDKTNGTYTVAAKSFVTDKNQKVEIVESAGTKEINRISVKVINLSADNYVLGQTYMTGNYDASDGVTKVVLYVDDKVKNSALDKENGTYKVEAKGLITSKDQKVQIVESIGSKEFYRINVTVK